MVKLCNLILKYSHFSEIDDDVFVYIDRILENAYEIYCKQQKARSDIDSLNKQLKENWQRLPNCPEHSPNKASAKKRKVRSVDASFAELKENSSILDDSRIFPCKSDPETSSMVTSVLEQNILDSEESFFALTQSPPRKQVLSPRNLPDSARLPAATIKLNHTSVPVPAGSLLRASRLSIDLQSPSRSTSIEPKSVGSSTPKAPCGQWTAKKKNTDNGTPRREHTPVMLNRFQSMMDGSDRLRQTKLNFSDVRNERTKETESAANEETFLSDFIVPTPPSVNSRSKFLRSLRIKKQSTMIDNVGKAQQISKSRSLATVSSKREMSTHTVAQDRPERANSLMETSSKEKKAENPQSKTLDDDYDIDQTFCPGAESFKRSDKDIYAKLKREPTTQCKQSDHKMQRNDPVTGTIDVHSEDTDSSGVVIISPKEETIISIIESQPPRNELYEAVLNDLREESKTGQPPLQFIMRASNNKDNVQKHSPTVKQHAITNGRIPNGLCRECSKLYLFHTSSGVSDDTARSKLPRNCRTCRLAQLHSTPPGFWDPGFLPTPK